MHEEGHVVGLAGKWQWGLSNCGLKAENCLKKYVLLFQPFSLNTEMSRLQIYIEIVSSIQEKYVFCHSFFILIIIYLIKSSDIVLVELFQILKDDAVKVLHSICQQIWKTQQWPQDWKRQFSFQSQRKAMPKNAQSTAQLHSSHTLVK